MTWKAYFFAFLFHYRPLISITWPVRLHSCYRPWCPLNCKHDKVIFFESLSTAVFLSFTFMVKQERKKSQGREANADRKLNVPFFNHLDNFVSHFSFTIQTDTVVTQQHQTYRWWNEKSSRQDFCFIHLCSKSGSLSDTNQILWSPINFPCSPRSR